MRSLAILLAVLGLPEIAHGQDAPTLRTHQVTVGAGVVWSGGYDIGDATASLRGNGPGATPPDVTLFTAESRVTPATSPELQVGFPQTPVRDFHIPGKTAAPCPWLFHTRDMDTSL